MLPDEELTATSVKPRRVKRARHILEGPALAEVTWLRFVRYLCRSEITSISSFISLLCMCIVLYHFQQTKPCTANIEAKAATQFVIHPKDM